MWRRVLRGALPWGRRTKVLGWAAAEEETSSLFLQV